MYVSSLSKLKDYVSNLKIKSSEELMILVAEKSSNEVSELIDFLNTGRIKFFGGIYPKLLVKNKSLSKGFIIQKYEPIYSSIVLPSLMRFKLDINEIKNCTALVLIDGLSDKVKELTDTIFNRLGTNVKYIGGGAGFYDLRHKPCIFNNNGLHENVLYICVVKSKVKLEVNHGWKVLDGPYKITKSNNNILSTLDTYPAFEVYRDIIQEYEGITLYKSDFFVYAKAYPFGITNNSQYDIIVRDPIMLNDKDEIVCVNNIPQNANLYILNGNIDTLLDSSLEIAQNCVKDVSYKYIPLLFDCVSRAMFMEDRFEEELTNIQNKLKFPVEGAICIGEIASQKNGNLIIHNKSTVLGLLN